MDSKKFFKIIPIIICFLIILSLAGSAMAAGLSASPGGFQIRFTGDLQTYTGQVIVGNIGYETLNIIINKKRMQKDDVTLLFSDGGIATWISVDPANFTLGPNETKTVTFKVDVPADINYYDAVGALIIQGHGQQPEINQGNQNLPTLQIHQVPELIVPIVLGLPGPIIESLQLLDHEAPVVLLSFMPGKFMYELNNNGTVFANMTGNIEISGLVNKHIIPIEGGVFPENNHTLIRKWEPGFFDFGIYNALTTINYGRYQATQTIKTDDTIIVIPVWLIIIILVALGIWIIKKKEIKSPIRLKIERK